MKEFILGLVLVAVISVVAALALGMVDMSAKSVYQEPGNVRL